MRSALIALSVCVAGCGGKTSLLLTVEESAMAAPTEAPSTLQVSLYAAGELAAPVSVSLGKKTLPGTIYIGPLDGALPDFRVQVDALDASGKLVTQAAARIALAAGAQTRATLTLAAPLADSDGDGVVDPIDDCPMLADPDQRCGAPPVDGAMVPPDLAGGQPDAGGVFACPKGAILCDDFESGDHSKWNALDITSTAMTLAVDQAMPLHGAFGLHGVRSAESASGTAYLWKKITPNLIDPLSPLAARAYVFLPSSIGSFGMVMALFNGTSGWAVGTDGSDLLVVSEDQSASPDHHSTYAWPFGRWVCLELRVTPPLYSVDVLADGVNVLSFMAASPTMPNEFQVGYARAPPTPASTLFIDDVILMSGAIGCE